MTPASAFALAVSLSMDSFAASLGRGAATGRRLALRAVGVGACFALFEVTALSAGWAAGIAFSSTIAAVDHWIAFVFLTAVGARMIFEGIAAERRPRRAAPPIPVRLIATAFATSVDAAAVGVSLAVIDLDIVQPAAILGGVTFLATVTGTQIGRRSGPMLGRRAEIVGGTGIVLIGAKILVESLYF